VATKSHIEVLGTVDFVQSSNSLKDEPILGGDNEYSVKHEQETDMFDRRKSDPTENRDSRACNDYECSSKATSVRKRQKQVKRWRIVSSSDEEADTLKDRFWRNLESGILPNELCEGDLYSSVRFYQCIAVYSIVLCCVIAKCLSPVCHDPVVLKD